MSHNAALCYTGDVCEGDYTNTAIIIHLFIDKSNATNLTAVKTGVCQNSYINLECRLVDGAPGPDQCKFYKNESQEWTQSNCKLNVRSTVVGTHIYRCMPSNLLGDAPNKTISIVTHGE